MERFRKVLDFCLNHQKALGYGAVSLLTLGSERIFSIVVFKCPCNSWNMTYGAVFLLVPALILFLLGLLINTRSWKVLTGCCAPGRFCRRTHANRLWRYFKILGMVMATASVAPFTWIAVALLGGSFYECAATGSAFWQRNICKSQWVECYQDLFKVPCQSTSSSSQVQDLLASLRAQSQVAGWILIASVFTLALVGTCISRCRSPVSILQLAFWKMYLEKEQQLFEVKAKEHAAQLAERNVRCFFDSTQPEQFQTPSNKAWHGISSLFAFNSEEHYYSMLHKYINCKTSSGSIRSVDGDIFPAALGFVDGAIVADSEVL